MKIKEVINILKKDGWYLSSQKGSHMQYKHKYKKGKVTVPFHGRNDEMGKYLTKSILKQAGLN